MPSRSRPISFAFATLPALLAALSGAGATFAQTPAPASSAGPATTSSAAPATASSALPSPAPTTAVAETAPAPRDQPPAAMHATRRSGFTFGLSSGVALGAAEGYPNDFSKMDNPAFRARAAGLGTQTMLWIGGALTDWFTFGFGLAGGQLGGNLMKSGSTTFLFHLESFPLFSLGNGWRDVGLSLDFGTGGGLIQRKRDDLEVANAGAFSVVGIGAFWETWRIANGHLTAGPTFSWQYQQSDSMVRYFGNLGLRGAFYGGP